MADFESDITTTMTPEFDTMRPSFRSPISTGGESRPAHFERGGGSGGHSQFEQIQTRIDQWKELPDGPEKERTRLYGEFAADGFAREFESIIEKNLRLTDPLRGLGWGHFERETRRDVERREAELNNYVITDNHNNELYRYREKFGGLATYAMEGALVHMNYIRLMDEAHSRPMQPEELRLIEKLGKEVEANSFMPFTRFLDEFQAFRRRDEIDRSRHFSPYDTPTAAHGRGAAGFPTPQEYGKAVAESMGVPTPEAEREMYRNGLGAMAEMAIGELKRPNFLLGRTEKELEEWRAMTQIVSAAYIKKETPGADKLFPQKPQDYILGVSKEHLKNVTNEKPGGLEAVSMLTYIIEEDIDIRALLNPYLQDQRNPRDNKRPAHLPEIQSRLGKSIFDIDDDPEFGQFKEGLTRWVLVNRPIPFVIDPNERDPQKARDKALAEQYALAKEAVDVMWAKIYISNLLEDRDSRFNPKREKGKRATSGLSELKSMATWMVMHPQERLEAKLKSGEQWSAVGPWAMRRKKGGLLSGGEVPGKSKLLEVLPKRTFKNALELIEDGARINVGRDKKPVQVRDRYTGEMRNKTLLDIYYENGRKLFNNPRIDINDLQKPDFGADMREGPFSGYYFDNVNPAVLVFEVINTGETKKTRKELGDALSKLGIERKYRKNIIRILGGINPKARNLSMRGGAIAEMGFTSGVLEDDPNFFEN